MGDKRRSSTSPGGDKQGKTKEMDNCVEPEQPSSRPKREITRCHLVIDDLGLMRMRDVQIARKATTSSLVTTPFHRKAAAPARLSGSLVRVHESPNNKSDKQ